MCGMRTLLCLFLTLASPGFANMSSPEGQLRTFANCAGRLTAKLEMQWLTEDKGADLTQIQRSQVIELLETVMPKDRGREVLSWRTDARAAQRALMEKARFSPNSDAGMWAAEQADVYLAECTSFLIS